jgi:hypothetical protein
MSYKEEVGLFLDVAGTPRATIDIAEICELAPDGVTPLQPLKLITDYCTLIAVRVVEDILRDHPAQDKIEDIIVSNDDFLFFTRDVNCEDKMCGRSTAFRRSMVSTIATKKTFRVALHLLDKSMKALKLLPRTKMASRNQLNFNPTFGIPTTVAAPPAPNKLVIAADIDLKPFKLSEFQALSRLSDIQHWYNAVHARGRICGIYTSPWEAFDKLSDMGSTWSIAHLDQQIIDRNDIMLAALNTLLSSKGIFKGECDDFTHIVINSSGNGYSALYNIVLMVHPLLGQVTTQPPQPAQRQNQSFSEHVMNYIGYFQSESCSGRKYSMNERVVLILSRLHPIWRDTMQRKYKQLVPQGGSSLAVPLECRQEMIGVTLTQWCVEERLDLPSTKPVDSTPVFAVDSQVHEKFGPAADTTPGTIQFADRSIDACHCTCHLSRRPQGTNRLCLPQVYLMWPPCSHDRKVSPTHQPLHRAGFSRTAP